MPRTAIVAITKNGITIANNIRAAMPEAAIYAPLKHKTDVPGVTWYEEQTAKLIADLFGTYDSLICIFSLGAVIRLLAPFIRDKKTDPAVIVIDDAAQFVISALSGHLGGANTLAHHVASIIHAQPVITTAADVNDTIAVDLVGRQFGWTIENDDNVTKVSAHMVNTEKMALYQSAGERNWWNGALPANVASVSSLEEAKSEQFKAALVISDSQISDAQIRAKSVIYRPKSLVVGVGLHRDTTSETIESGIKQVFEREGLVTSCIKKIATVSREGSVKGLVEFCHTRGLELDTHSKETLASVEVPNPSDTVRHFEGTASVSEAAALLSSGGDLIVPKQKFPPDLTVAVCRIRYT